jgi:alpha-galactosidase
MALVLALSLIPLTVQGYNNGLGAVPPMGWNTWCTDDLCGLLDRCTEAEVHSIADAISSNGMKELGYEYINLDDCWADGSRDENGKLQGQPLQFPSGMASLADYVHSKGLKLGLYTCVGTETCKKRRPGSYGHFEIDAQTFADWGVDFVKADFCSVPANETGHTQELYTDFSNALNATGRPMLFSLCEWGTSDVSEWGGEVGQMFRIQMDHIPFWHYPPQAAGAGYGQGVGDIIEFMGYLDPSKYTEQYGWMDPDFLMTLFMENYTAPDGKTIMNFMESRTEFSFWSLWASPLIVATDPRNMSEAKRSIIMNEEVIAINQDSLYKGGTRLQNNTDGSEVWSKDLLNGDIAVILYNRGNSSFGGGDAVDVTVTWSELGWSDEGQVFMRDVWGHTDVTPSDPATGHTVTLVPKDVSMYRLSKTSTSSSN